ncbi:orotidine 5'-phosphate decarboxylase [Helicobacter sp. 12S02634-8]|uniref:orotidine-5'-phosphate decarboxylase n=1 Tax=Helicobacter sp. 12S02634-8 TaxID=1476199 RepID=UPI000BA701CF|nr:orotidine-5'-phosphate decarboxylase [Helicobacter sp. 12S02634-8]PAF47499.1 orotidine 5'-phosphate decarboxylase [Helicobacter sp. 12S02634-8]
MQLCIALDLESQSKNLSLLQEVKDFDVWIKIGLRSYIRDGVGLLEKAKKLNPDFKIFLDLKLYDIPNTMADAAFECAQVGADMLTLHTSSGKIAMQSVMERLDKLAQRPLVMGVSALTSFENVSFEPIYNAPLDTHAPFLARLGYESGIDGAVCSVYESLAIKASTNPTFLTLTPAIRPFEPSSDDQKRVSDLMGAKQALADFIVIGRPIYHAPQPAVLVAKILQTIQEMENENPTH